MSFLQPVVLFGRWYEVDGPMGTEIVPADLVGEPEWIEFGEPYGNDDPRATEFFESLSTYTENRAFWLLSLVEGWGSRLSASGYMDCTSWSLHPSEAAARAAVEEESD